MNFSKLLMKPAKYNSFHYQNLNLRLDLQKQKTSCSVIVTRMKLNISTDKFEYCWGLKRTRLASFPSKNLNITVINSFAQKLSTWVTAKSNITKRIDFLLPTSVTFLGAITKCSAFTPDFGYDNSTILLIGDVYCPNAKCSGKLCRHKKTFQSPGRSDYQCPQCASVCQVRCILLKIQQNPLSCRLVKGFTFLKKTQSQFKMLLEMSIVLASIVPSEKNANLLPVM